MHLTAGITWVGLQLGDFVIDELIGHGSFSDVYRAHHHKSGIERAIKTTRASEVAGTAATVSFPTRALVKVTGSIAKALPDTTELLHLQYEKLATISQFPLPDLIAVHEFVEDDSVCYYSMDYIAGGTLRNYILNNENNSLPEMYAIAMAMHNVLTHTPPPFKYHGDLKPDNVLIKNEINTAGNSDRNKDGITIIDPGHFGELKLENGLTDLHVAVTTPEYYPSLAPDDPFAFGVMLWEACTGYHPFAERRSSEDFDLSNVSEDLVERIKMREAVGNYFLSPILGLPDPHDLNASIPPGLEAVLFKLLHLKKLDGMLTSTDGFVDFISIAEALVPFMKQ